MCVYILVYLCYNTACLVVAARDVGGSGDRGAYRGEWGGGRLRLRRQEGRLVRQGTQIVRKVEKSEGSGALMLLKSRRENDR